LTSKYDDGVDSSITNNAQTWSRSLPEKTIFFHRNDHVLYDNIDTDKEIFKDKIILIIGTGSIKRMSVIRNLKNMNFKKCINLIREPNWAQKYFDGFILAEHEDIGKKEETLQAIQDYMRLNSIRFDAIYTYDDYCTLLTSYITTALNYPGIPHQVVARIRDKYAFRKYSHELGITHPNHNHLTLSDRTEHLRKICEFLATEATVVESNQNDFFRTIIQIQPPIIVKNALGSGKGE
jgi:hypothetical protein